MGIQMQTLFRWTYQEIQSPFLCKRGSTIKGIDFFETCAPVVQWTTIRLMFILEILLGLKSKQGDITCAYGLWQSLRTFWKYITEKLETCGLEQSKFDPCFFVGTKVICVVYVDDLIFWCKDTLAINDSAMQLRDLGVDLEQEELFPIMDMVSSVTKSVKLPIGKTTMNVSIHEDNSGALVLAKTLPPQFTPRSKYYAIKTIWFCEEIFKRDVQLHKIDTAEQLGDIFTKGLTHFVFEYLRKKIMGW